MTVSEFIKKIFSRPLLGNCLGVVIVTLLLGIGSLVFINFYTHHGDEVIVPNVCGMDQGVAEKKLRAMGLRMEVTDTGYVYNAAPFSVLEQNIKAGEKVKPGRIILITINANGPRQIAIPDVQTTVRVVRPRTNSECSVSNWLLPNMWLATPNGCTASR